MDEQSVLVAPPGRRRCTSPLSRRGLLVGAGGALTAVAVDSVWRPASASALRHKRDVIRACSRQYGYLV